MISLKNWLRNLMEFNFKFQGRKTLLIEISTHYTVFLRIYRYLWDI